MRVLIIPEDFRTDQYTLKPIIGAMLSKIGKSSATVEVCRDPLLGGVAQALRWERIREIIEEYFGIVDLYLLCVDRDGQPGRRGQLDTLEARLRKACQALGSFWWRMTGRKSRSGSWLGWTCLRIGSGLRCARSRMLSNAAICLLPGKGA